jgi:hypothetical protein
MTPRFSPVEFIEAGTHTMSEGVSTVTTVLPVPPLTIEIVPNPDILTKAVDLSTVGYDYIDRAHALADMLGLAFM